MGSHRRATTGPALALTLALAVAATLGPAPVPGFAPAARAAGADSRAGTHDAATDAATDAPPAARAAAQRIVERANALRAREGLPPLGPDPQLAAAALAFARHMAATGRYGHEADGRDPGERAAAAGYRWCRVAENIAWQVRSDGWRTPQALADVLADGWERSPGHRANLLDGALTQLGIGLAQAPSGRWYAVQLFGRPHALGLRFRVANEGRRTIEYGLDGERFTLPPATTRTHRSCGQGRLDGPAGRVQAADGARYAWR